MLEGVSNKREIIKQLVHFKLFNGLGMRLTIKQGPRLVCIAQQISQLVSCNHNKLTQQGTGNL